MKIRNIDKPRFYRPRADFHRLRDPRLGEPWAARECMLTVLTAHSRRRDRSQAWPWAGSPLRACLNFGTFTSNRRRCTSLPKGSFDSQPATTLETFRSRIVLAGQRVDREAGKPYRSQRMAPAPRTRPFIGISSDAAPWGACRASAPWIGYVYYTGRASGESWIQAACVSSPLGLASPGASGRRISPSSLTSSNRTETRFETPDSCIVTP